MKSEASAVARGSLDSATLGYSQQTMNLGVRTKEGQRYLRGEILQVAHVTVRKRVEKNVISSLERKG